jgi:hypothetical protein
MRVTAVHPRRIELRPRRRGAALRLRVDGSAELDHLLAPIAMMSRRCWFATPYIRLKKLTDRALLNQPKRAAP